MFAWSIQFLSPVLPAVLAAASDHVSSPGGGMDTDVAAGHLEERQEVEGEQGLQGVQGESV